MIKCMNCGHDSHCGVRLFREEKNEMVYCCVGHVYIYR